MSLAVLKDNFTPKSGIFRLAVRAAVALCLAVGAAHALGLEQGMWLPLTVLVILRPSLGGTLRIGWQRTAGTVAGAAIGISILLFGGNDPALLVPCLLATIFFAFFLNAYTYSGFSAAITVGLILVMGLVVPEGWKMGMVRVLDTVFGVGIGIGASFLIWPNMARKQLRTNLESIITAQAGLFSLLGKSYLSGKFSENEILSARIEVVNTLEEVSTTFKEAAAEPGLTNAQRRELSRLYKTLMRMQRLLVGLSTVLRRGEQGPLPQLEKGMKEYLDTTRSHFDWLVQYTQAPESCGKAPDFTAPTDIFLEFAATVRASGELDSEPTARRNNISAFIWHIQSLARELQHAHDRIHALRNG